MQKEANLKVAAISTCILGLVFLVLGLYLPQFFNDIIQQKIFQVSAYINHHFKQ